MTVSERLRVRVWVQDVWDHVTISADPEETVAEVKRRALTEATGRTPDPDEYQIKFRGALMIDETRTLAQLGVPDRAPMIVLPAHRQPVR
jgi:hypothetical protein